MSPQSVVLVGLGVAGADHYRALRQTEGTAVVAGVDVSPSHRQVLESCGIPVYASVFDLASEKTLDPDIVVVATPTPTHAAVCGEVAEYFGKATIVVEKPASDNLEDAQRIVDGVGGKQPVRVAYHMAFSPEVEWALARAAEAQAGGLGAPVSIESWYCDPYADQLASARIRFGSSWLDSGINALSVIERFAKVVERTALGPVRPVAGSTPDQPAEPMFEGSFICHAQGRPVTALVVTSWNAAAPAKSTRIRYSSGAELVMDHHAMAGYLVHRGRVAAQFAAGSAVPRREAHYRALYRTWLIERSQVFSMETSLRLHRLLLDPMA